MTKVRLLPDGTTCWCWSEAEYHAGWRHSPECEKKRQAMDEAVDLRATFDLVWKASMDGIAYWQRVFNKPLTWPDTAAEHRWLVGESLGLRTALWTGHGHGGLYGDDGEMQCSACGVDYLRAEPEVVVAAALNAATMRPAYHEVDMREEGYGLAHPLACLPALLECEVHRFLAETDEPPVEPGRWRLDMVEGVPRWVSLDAFPVVISEEGTIQ